METLDLLAARVAARRRELDSMTGQARAVLARSKELASQIENLEVESSVLEQTALLLTTLGEQRQAQAQGTIETLVTQGLQTIFDDTLSFHIVSEVKAKTSQVTFVVRSGLSDTAVETPVLDARGGGLAAVVGFLLRMVVLLLSTNPGDQRLLVLDETFSMVSAEYLPGVSAFLRQVVDRTGIQILMVTHQEVLTENADVVYRFSQTDGRTKVVAL